MSRSRVALVRAVTRREGVRSAMELVADDIRPRIKGTVVVKPNLGCGIIPKQKAASHIDGLRGLLDFLVSCGPAGIVLAEGGQDASLKYEAFGYAALEREYGIRFVDINRETRWTPLRLTKMKGGSLSAGMSRTVLEADCRVSLALPKTHDLVVTSLSLKNMMGCLNRQECKHMHGITQDMWWHRWIPAAVRRNVAKVSPALGFAVRRGISRIQERTSEFTGQACDPRFTIALGQRPLEMISEMSHVLSLNLAALAGPLHPHVSVIDGFTGLEGEGPTAGDAVDVGVALASADFLAADATTARLMGFDPALVEYMHLIESRGLGRAAAEAIEIIGETLQSSVRRFRAHPDIAGQLIWRNRIEGSVEAPAG